MGPEFISKQDKCKPGALSEATSCCQCGCKLESRQKRIRMKERDFICESCYRNMLYPETTFLRRETVE